MIDPFKPEVHQTKKYDVSDVARLSSPMTADEAKTALAGYWLAVRDDDSMVLDYDLAVTELINRWEDHPEITVTYQEHDIDDHAATIDVPLNIYDLRLLNRALKAHVAKLEKTAQRQNFTPEPGRVNVTQEILKRAEKLQASLYAALKQVDK